MDVYISSSSVEEARELRDTLKAEGIDVVSTWHDQEPGTPGFLPDDQKARRNFEQIEVADRLVLIASPGLVTGGKFVEAGYAEGYGTRVVILGRRENGILASEYHFDQVDTVQELVNYLQDPPGCY